MDTKITKSEQEWRQELTPHQYEILRRKGTEPAFSGEYAFSKQEAGMYRCAACGSALFSSDAKFDSGRAGRASPSRRSPKRSSCGPTTACSCGAPR